MSESLVQFFQEHPFWAVFIAVFMILPMIGAVLHIVLKALGRKGIDNSLPGETPVLNGKNGIDEDRADSPELRRGDDESGDIRDFRSDSGS